MNREDRQELYSLIEQWTRAEIMARYLPFHWLEYGDYYFQHLQLEDRIRELMFGTKDLTELGERWGLFKEIRDKKKERVEHNKGKPIQASTPNKERNNEQIERKRRRSDTGRRKPLI